MLKYILSLNHFTFTFWLQDSIFVNGVKTHCTQDVQTYFNSTMGGAELFFHHDKYQRWQWACSVGRSHAVEIWFTLHLTLNSQGQTVNDLPRIHCRWFKRSPDARHVSICWDTGESVNDAAAAAAVAAVAAAAAAAAAENPYLKKHSQQQWQQKSFQEVRSEVIHFTSFWKYTK